MSSLELNRLATMFPPTRLLSRPEQLAAYESDGLTAFRTRPLAVVIPETADEVIAVVRLCREETLPFVARGSGTSLSGGSLPVPGGIVIALNRMNRILRLDSALRLQDLSYGDPRRRNLFRSSPIASKWPGPITILSHKFC